jgi:hypothetical protein
VFGLTLWSVGLYNVDSSKAASPAVRPAGNRQLLCSAEQIGTIRNNTLSSEHGFQDGIPSENGAKDSFAIG